MKYHCLYKCIQVYLINGTVDRPLLKKLYTPPLSRPVETNQARLTLARTVAYKHSRNESSPFTFPHPFVKIIDLLLCEGLEETRQFMLTHSIHFFVARMYLFIKITSLAKLFADRFKTRPHTSSNHLCELNCSRDIIAYTYQSENIVLKISNVQITMQFMKNCTFNSSLPISLIFNVCFVPKNSFNYVKYAQTKFT